MAPCAFVGHCTHLWSSRCAFVNGFLCIWETRYLFYIIKTLDHANNFAYESDLLLCFKMPCLLCSLSGCAATTETATGCIKANVRIVCPSSFCASSSVDSIADCNDFYLLWTHREGMTGFFFKPHKQHFSSI